ncbi:U4/U6.U5 tri-snRNP-associated protein 1-like isoform X2 [Tachypleus tridentatus]|uniref:U4/U6.U5 tri-snRNP-associated protein 1-like isoform X2 n=1 Tax=Tachypleus tridentatus TaxID=6853 RepID=UPI003FD65E17
MGSKKHKEKDREKKKRKRSKSRSRSKSPKEKRHKSKHEKSSGSHRERDGKKKRHRKYDYESPPEEYAEDEQVQIKEELEEDVQVKNEASDVEEGEIEVRDKVNRGAGANISLSIEEANRLRAKLGLKPLQVKEDKPVQETSGGGENSLSVAETNKLRAKIGLKPLQLQEEIPGLEQADGDNDGEEEDRKEVFVKTENISDKKKEETMREKLKIQKEKRKIADKLSKTKGLGESDSEGEDVLSWVKKSRELQEEREKADKRAKMLAEMDEEFGVGALVEGEFKEMKASVKNYTSKDLQGLTVGHGVDAFKEGRSVVMTLRDRDVLDEGEDVLESINIVEEDKASRNVENKKKKPDYRPYEEPEFDEFGIVKKKSILSKYDEELEGPKKELFKIGCTSTGDREKNWNLSG